MSRLDCPLCTAPRFEIKRELNTSQSIMILAGLYLFIYALSQ